MMRRLLFINLMIIISLGLFGCMGSKSASNKKSTNPIVHFVDDQTLAIKASLALGKDKALSKQSHISILSHKKAILLVGQTPTLELKIRAEELVRKVPKVTKIYNQLTAKKPIKFTARAKDAWITTQVKAKLFAEPKLSSYNIKVITEEGVVYLMGTPKLKDREKAIEIVAKMKNVKQVVDVFNINAVNNNEAAAAKEPSSS